MNPTAWAIRGVSPASSPVIGVQYAQLFGFATHYIEPGQASSAWPSHPLPSLILLNYPTLMSLDPKQKGVLREIVRRGATVYMRGGLGGHSQCSLAPFSGDHIDFIPFLNARSYRFTSHRLVPRVLTEEIVEGDFVFPVAAREPSQASAIAVCDDETPKPFIFAVTYGAGTAVYDLTPDRPFPDAKTPIIQRLADPISRPHEIGALVAVRLAARLHSGATPPFNLCVDDRPANYDYFTGAAWSKWLQHAESLLPGLRIDFGWIPDRKHPHVGFIDLVRRFNTGFVWHGLHRHDDHVLSSNLSAEYEQGRRIVTRLEQKFGIKFEPVMILPFERFNRTVLEFLKETGFVATVAHSDHQAGGLHNSPPYLLESTALDSRYLDCFPVLRRHRIEELGRDLMLAKAALNLPIVLGVHPGELGLQRWRLGVPSRDATHAFDHVLRFAAEKQLRPRSLEQIAAELRLASDLEN